MTKKVQFTLKNKVIQLPSFPGSQVELKSLTVAERIKITGKYDLSGKSENSKEAQDAGIEMLIACIVDWNLFNGEEKVPVTRETIDQMPEGDVLYMIYCLQGGEINTDKKKE